MADEKKFPIVVIGMEPLPRVPQGDPPLRPPAGAAPKKPTPKPKPKPKPTTRTPAQLAGLAKARDTKAAKDVEITPALIKHVLEHVTLRFFPSYGPREAYVINAGAEHTVTFGPFPEAARTAADEWSDFLELVIAIDGDATAYPVVGPHDRSD